MNFFKKLFSGDKKENEETGQQKTDFAGVYTDEYFNKRYSEENLNANPVILDGCLKMVDSYFLEYNLAKKVNKPLNHPSNLDQVVNEGIGFHEFCKKFNFGDSQVVMFLSYAFSDFLVKTYGFKYYKDSAPEFPMRSMTLKYNKNGTVLSLYPFEYALKVLNKESTFENLYNRIHGQLEVLPSADEIIKGFTEKN